MELLDRVSARTIALAGIVLFFTFLLIDTIGFKLWATTLVTWLPSSLCSIA
ncbi:hypothetical protein [Teredinibacter turnerae]|uniref:hypothetical protein n=1 Tax=Teredinibacter turnerae TaxID=2426 RepID=UPI000370865C|nr:hypothetical protein [Teredinibacter turnerae]